MPAPESLEQTVKRVVAARFKIAPDALGLDTQMREDLGADSLDLLEIVFEIEQELGLVLREAPIGDLRTIGDAVRHLESLSP